MTAPSPAVTARRPAPLRLHAGHLTAIFEPDTGWLRHISLGGFELVRAVYGAVRDQHWRTITPRIRALDTVVRERSFDIQFLNRCEEEDIAYAWQAHIRGTAEACSFRFDGEAGSSFLRNRIGLCLLHPIEGCAGRPCTVEHVDGTTTETAFPDLISPHQPFFSIRRLSWVTDTGRVTVRFEGEAFETEDQRNWTDASFKTYGTPLDLPRPVQVALGDRVQQRIDILVEPARTLVAVAEDKVVDLRPDGPARPKPPVGLGMVPAGHAFTGVQHECLRVLAPDHLRVDVRPGADTAAARERIAEASRAARSLGAGLHLAALLPEDGPAGLEEMASAARDAGARVDLLLVLAEGQVASPDWVAPARNAFAQAGLTPELATGTNRYFAELNRNRPPREADASPAFSLNPQVHAFDDLSLVENLEAQPWALRTARAFSDRPVAISPITLRPRFTPDAADRVVIGANGLPEHVDVRQQTLFGAAWTLGSLARLLPLEGVHSLTYYEAAGLAGVLDGDLVFPLYHVLADLAGVTRVQALASSVPSRVVGLLLQSDTGSRLLAANLTDHATRMRAPIAAASCTVRTLDERCLRQATVEPAVFRANTETRQVSGGRLEIELPAYATLRVDWA
jgi:D-apionolactonase